MTASHFTWFILITVPFFSFQLLESNRRIISFNTPKPCKNHWNEDGSDIPTIHDGQGDGLSKSIMCFPCWFSQDEGPAEVSVDNEHEHHKLTVSPHHHRGDKGERNKFLQNIIPALLDGHQQHAQLPGHVRNVVHGEFFHSFIGAKFAVGRIHKDHVEISEEDEEPEKCVNFCVSLEILERGFGMAGNAKVVANTKKAEWHSVKHNDQG